MAKTLQRAIFVVGAPGAGKTTLCRGLKQLLNAMQVPCTLVNLDPAAEDPEGDFDVDCRALCTLQTDRLGPNGALLQAMEDLYASKALLSTLMSRYTTITADDSEDENEDTEYREHWTLFDLPGQVELYTSHWALQRLLREQLSCTSRRDSLYASRVALGVADAAASCATPQRYLASLCVALQSMLYVECPMLHVFSKTDLASTSAYGDNGGSVWRALGGMHSACTVLDALDRMDLHDSLSRALREVLQDYAMLSFIPLAVEDKRCILYLWHQIQLASGSVLANGDPASVALSDRQTDDYFDEMAEAYDQSILEDAHLDDE